MREGWRQRGITNEFFVFRDFGKDVLNTGEEVRDRHAELYPPFIVNV
jgi:hypothetical protein